MPAIKSILKGLFMSAALSSGFSAAADEPNKKSADLIVGGDYMVTQDPRNPVIKNGGVAVKDGQIIAVGTLADILAAYQARDILDGTDRILMPGLVNGHSHAAMTLFRGIADDLDLMTWLTQYIFPMEGRFVDAGFVKTGTELACLEMIKSGTTTFADMYFYADTVAETVEKCGIRAIVGSAMIDFPSPGYQGWDDSFKSGVDFVRRWQNKPGASGRVTPALAPHAPYTVSQEHLVEAASAAKTLGAPITIHLSEDYSEITTIKERYGTTPVRHLGRTGLLENQVIAAHVVWPTDDELPLMARANFGAIHNPTSNMKTAAGLSPVPKMLEAGINVGLGTDGAASNNNLDMWQEIHLAALLHKGFNRQPTLMPAETVIRMATLGGAKAIGLGDVTGSLEVGKRADIIQISVNDPALTPLYSVVSHLAYAVNANHVVTTIVDGNVLMREGRVQTLDQDQIIADARAKAAQIKAAMASQAAKAK